MRHTPSPRSTRRPAARPLALAGVVVLLAGACSGGTGAPSAAKTSSSPINTTSSIRGQSITVLLPSYSQIPKPLLAQFTKKTGVKVTLNAADFDAVHQQLVTAAVAGSNIADVSEVDWSWVGQFGQAGWYQPLDGALGKDLLADMQNLGAFRFKGKLLAVPFSNDFRIVAYNKADFAKAGIAGPPTTFAQLTKDLQTLKDKNVSRYPLTLSLSATEGTATQWYLLTLAMGGKIFDDSLKPVFNQPGSIASKALQFQVDAVKRGFVTPGSVSNTDQQSDDRFYNGSASYTFSGPDELVGAADPKTSKIVGQAALALVPGVSGPGQTFGAPEGIGIPAASKHKAAAVAFLRWMTSAPTVIALRNSIGVLPARSSVLKTLSDSGKLLGGKQIEQEIPHVTPLFPQGTPSWYPKFSSEAGALVNSAAKGDVTVAQALSRLDATARKLGSR